MRAATPRRSTSHAESGVPHPEERTTKITLSVIKADIGSIGGHMAPSRLHNIAGRYTGTSYFDGPPLVSCAALEPRCRARAA